MCECVCLCAETCRQTVRTCTVHLRSNRKGERAVSHAPTGHIGDWTGGISIAMPRARQAGALTAEPNTRRSHTHTHTLPISQIHSTPTQCNVALRSAGTGCATSERVRRADECPYAAPPGLIAPPDSPAVAVPPVRYAGDGVHLRHSTRDDCEPV